MSFLTSKTKRINELLSLQQNEKMTTNETSVIFMYDDLIMDILLEDSKTTKFLKWLFTKEVFD